MTTTPGNVGRHVGAAAKLALASLAFAEAEEWWGPAMVDWIEAFEPLDDLDSLEVAADVDLDHLRWRLRGPTNVVAPRAVGWLEMLALDTAAASIESAAEVAGGLVSNWVDVGDDGLRSGWDVEVSSGVDLEPLWDHLPRTPALRSLSTWASAEGVASLHRIGVMAGADGDCEVTLSLPGGTIDEQMASALGLFDHLEVELLDDLVLGLLSAGGRPRLLARIALTSDGVASLGIGSVEPSTELVLHLCDAMGVGDDDALAAFEGALGITDRLLVEAVQAPRPTIRVSYRVS